MNGLQGLDYSPLLPKEETPQAQSPSVNPMQLMSMIKEMMGGATGAETIGTGAIEGSGGLETIGAGITEGSGGVEAAGSKFGGIFSNPWAWLAAAIVGNELYAKHRGYRSKDTTQYIKDLFTGEVFHQDLEQRFLPDLGLDEGSTGNKVASLLLNPLGTTGDPRKTWDRIKDIF